MRRRISVSTMLLFLILILWSFKPAAAQGPEETPQPTPTPPPLVPSTWSEPVNISNTPNSSWFPDLAIDSQGNVHVVWSETTQREEGGEKEQVLYTKWDGAEWSAPNDIVAPSPNIIRKAITVDRADQLHLTYGYPGTGALGLFYVTAPAEGGWSAANWSAPRLVNIRGLTYANDLEVDSEGRLHLIFDDRGNQEAKQCPSCADIFYRRSTDGGQSWDAARVLADVPLGSSRAQMEIDANDIIHVTWDEGWDRISGRGAPNASLYTFSNDRGLTWSTPLTISEPVTGTAQLSVGSNNHGGVMLVWRAVSDQNIYYQWSADGGLSWTTPNTITTLMARRWSTPFDAYDMTTDSQGHIHLIVVGAIPDVPDDPLGVYHMEWDDLNWSDPELIYKGDGFPEYPRIKISQGNQLHAVWFTRDDMILRGNYEVWYSTDQSAAPPQPPAPTFTPLPTPTASPVPTPIPQATPLYGETLPPAPPSGAVQKQDLYTDHDNVLLLLVALSPLLLIATGIFAYRRGWLRR